MVNQKSLNALYGSLIFALVATGVSYWVAFANQWITGVNYVEMAAVFASYSCTYMCVKETRWNYPMGILGTALYSYVYIVDWQMYALGAFNLYLVFSLAYGYNFWRSDFRPVKVTNLGLNLGLLGYIGFGFIVYGLLMIAIHTLNGVTTPTEVWITVLSGVAQLMLDRKKLQTWMVWAVVNVISIQFYFQNNYPIVGFQYIFFLANTVYGYLSWRSSMKNGTKPVTPIESANA